MLMKYWMLTLLIWTIGCKNIVRHSDTDIEFMNVELIDTFTNVLSYKTAESITTSAYHPMYIGPELDTIHLSYKSRNLKHRFYDWDKYEYPDSSGLIVFVDTTKFVGTVNRFRIVPPPPPPNYQSGDSINFTVPPATRGDHYAYPVYIKNMLSDTISVGYGDYIPLILEAKDSLGLWKPIQKNYRYHCGTGLSHYYLPPSQISIISCPIFDGSFSTKLRLKYGYPGKIISNEFFGNINHSQFDKSNNLYY